MNPPTVRRAGWKLAHGRIYQAELQKRIDVSPSQTTAVLQVAHMNGSTLEFKSASARGQAFRDGVFMLAIPNSIDCAPCDRFSREFHKCFGKHPYSRFRHITGVELGDPLLGFHQRINQIEQFLLEHRFWKAAFPQEIANVGLALTTIAGQILRSVLMLGDIPRRHWRTATGGCAAGMGSYHLTFNHYRPSLPGIGLPSHKDDGFMTILRTTEPGLEINRHDRWETVSPDRNHFIVNFGLAMEVLTQHSTLPVNAIMHRVRHQAHDRSSFGHFSSSYCEPGADAGIFAYDSEYGLRRVCASRELIDANDHEIYQGTELTGDEE